MKFQRLRANAALTVIALSGTPAATSATPPTESVRLLDLTDPKNPKTLQTFRGVTSVLADQGRNLIYIANGQGLMDIVAPRTPTDAAVRLRASLQSHCRLSVIFCWKEQRLQRWEKARQGNCIGDSTQWNLCLLDGR